MGKGKNAGLSVLELLVVLFIFSLLSLATAAYFHSYHRTLLLDSTVKKIVEAVGLAREYAVNERKEFYVVFSDTGFVVLRENKNLVGKQQRFPANITVTEKSAGFDPVVFLPDGTSETAGYLKVGDTVNKKEIKIVLHNITGRCFISDGSEDEQESER
jgi:Tfp pilus assembly protein FimT